jgi:hypothetical protein
MTDRPKDTHVEHIRQIGNDVKECIESLAKENELLGVKLEAVEREKAALGRKISTLEEEVAAHANEHRRLMAILDETTSDNKSLHRNLNEVVAQSNDLTNLYVSSYQLHGSLDHEDVLAALKEIIINIVGSERFLILGLREDGETCEAVDAFGVEDSELSGVLGKDGVVGEVLQSGETFVANGSRRAEYRGIPVEACFPMFLEGDTFGAVVIFELLPQKPNLSPGDQELFGLLSTHAASALHSAQLHKTHRG